LIFCLPESKAIRKLFVIQAATFRPRFKGWLLGRWDSSRAIALA
jgi:hypothetical protein